MNDTMNNLKYIFWLGSLINFFSINSYGQNYDSEKVKTIERIDSIGKLNQFKQYIVFPVIIKETYKNEKLITKNTTLKLSGVCIYEELFLDTLNQKSFYNFSGNLIRLSKTRKNGSGEDLVWNYSSYLVSKKTFTDTLFSLNTYHENGKIDLELSLNPSVNNYYLAKSYDFKGKLRSIEFVNSNKFYDGDSIQLNRLKTIYPTDEYYSVGAKIIFNDGAIFEIDYFDGGLITKIEIYKNSILFKTQKFDIFGNEILEVIK
jgi:hypothetical protein